MKQTVTESQPSNFYCQKICGEQHFDIKEWNDAYKSCIDMGLSESDTRKIIEGEPYKTQCVDCACIVGERKSKTRKLLNLFPK